MSKVLSVRIDDRLYTRICKQDLGKKDLVVKAVSQYLRSKEPNCKIDSELYTNVNNPYTNELIDSIKDQVDILKSENSFLRSQVNTLMFVKNPGLIEKIKLFIGNHSK